MRKIAVSLCLMVATLLVAAVSMAGSPNMNPGKWEITTTVEMPGMPMKMPPVTTTRCMTKDDLIFKEPPQAGVPRGMENDPCKVTNTEVKGDTVIWDVVCQGKGEKMVTHGEITYHGDTLEGVIKMSGNQKKGQPPITLNLKGKRIGPCDK